MDIHKIGWSAIPWKQTRKGVEQKAFSGSAATVALHRLMPGHEPRPHSHPHEQIAYIIEGRMMFYIGDEKHEVGPGGLVVIPGGVTHWGGALVDYAEEGNQLWTCPGHNGGVFYSRSPIGRVFMEHLGEAVFRDDLDNSVLDLGDLLTHEGPALRAQKEAAQIFGAEKTNFVLNGTSTSNKVALSALVADGDLVLFDRNNHKAALHGALMISGGIPIYVPTVRNPWGLIGPMSWDEFDEKALRERIRTNPLVKDPEAWRRERPFRVAVVEQCTY